MLRTSYEDGILRIFLSGELDHHTARETLRQTSQSLFRYLPRLCVLDISAVRFMDSSGIAVILNTVKQIRQMDGQFSLLHREGQPLRVLEASGIGKMISISASESEENE